MREKRDMRIENTQQALYRAINELIIHKSSDQISITELCKAANIQRSTFYSHYNNISELMDVYIDDALKELEKEIFQVPIETPIVPTFYFERLFLCLARRPDLSRMLLTHSMRHTFTIKIMQLIRIKCLNEWELKFFPLNENKASFVFEFFSAGMLGTLNKWISTGQKESPEFMAYLVRNILAEGENVLAKREKER